jgi:hypothetical protein
MIHEEFNSELQETRRDRASKGTEASRRDLENTWLNFETQFAAVQARTRRVGNAEATTDMEKPSKFDGFTYSPVT